MCIDYRELNKILMKNQYPFPRIDELIDCLKGAKFITKLDLKLGYHQISIDPSGIWNTTFKT